MGKHSNVYMTCFPISAPTHFQWFVNTFFIYDISNIKLITVHHYRTNSGIFIMVINGSTSIETPCLLVLTFMQVKSIYTTDRFSSKMVVCLCYLYK